MEPEITILLEYDVASRDYTFPTFRSVFVFKGLEVRTSRLLMIRPVRFVETSGERYPTTQRHIPQEEIPHPHRREIL